MSRDPYYDVLFEPVRIGPLLTRNRFYQVPHCNGMGHRMPRAHAAMREVKAEGGWAVVCTEEVEIHPSGDLSPDVENRLWDDRDVPALALVAEAVHRHGALAGIQLSHNGAAARNLYSRLPPLAPSHQPVRGLAPVQARAMTRADIRALRRWHRQAALRAREAGFDIIYVYAGHDLSLPMHFLQLRRNHRTDEYGGSLENRSRLLRELLVETREAIGDRCAVALRLAVDELMGERGICADGEGRELVELLAELPDLWDVNVSDWSNDTVSSRFAPEGYQEQQVAFVKQLTSKPVVGVGRFTSPDAMVAQVRRGVLDLVGAARPSIADPFLPRKVEEGRIDEIRECIGCNVCVSGDHTATPIRCTQNPTMGEEWRRGWHPERVAPHGLSGEPSALVVGAGPAGLECALVLAQRGFHVYLAEAARELGGRVLAESRLPGLAEWRRVRDVRTTLLRRQPGVEQARGSRVTVDDVLALRPDYVAIATGARWRRDGAGRAHPAPLWADAPPGVLTPDDLMADDGLARVEGPVVIFDDDHYYLGGVLAEALRARGLEVTLVTPAAVPAAWTANTLELDRIQRRLHAAGVRLVLQHQLARFDGERLSARDIHTDATRAMACRALVLLTARAPNEGLYLALADGRAEEAGIRAVRAVGDCLCPSTIAAAIHDGHLAGRTIELRLDDETVPFERELPAV
jgi:dimethylamine/trimethylamine dehydrogenase